MSVAQKTLPLEAFEDPPDRDGLTARQVAMHDLWETLVGLARAVCLDSGPRTLDKLIVLHAITNPTYRWEPAKAEHELKQFLLASAQRAGSGYLVDDRYVGAALAAFAQYAQAITPKKRAAPKTEPKVEVNIQSVDRELDF